MTVWVGRGLGHVLWIVATFFWEGESVKISEKHKLWTHPEVER